MDGSAEAGRQGQAVRVDPVHLDPVHLDAVRLLTGWQPSGAEQARWRDELLVHLAAHPDATRRDGPPAHLTASAVVLDPSGAAALLVLHRKAGLWVQPGGHLEPGDTTVVGAALREASEESGLSPGDLHLALDGRPLDLSRHAFAFGTCAEHLDVTFLLVADPAVPTAASDESERVAWWDLDDLPDGVVADLPPRLRAAADLLAADR